MDSEKHSPILQFHSAAPVVTSSAARPPPPRFPPTKTVESIAASALTVVPAGFGFQEVASPVALSNAARCLRDWPPIVTKVPPAYTLEPWARRTLTGWNAFGLQAVKIPVVASKAAALFRAKPPMFVN